MEKWVDEVIVLAHKYKITQTEIANEYGCQREFINRILNGTEKPPKGASERILSAVHKLVEKKKQTR